MILATLFDPADPTILALSGLKLVTVILGFIVIHLSWKAYRGSGRKPFLWLTVALTLMTVGAIAEGAAYQGLRLGLDQSHVIEALFTLAAFGVLVYSLFVRDAPRPAGPAEPAHEEHELAGPPDPRDS